MATKRQHKEEGGGGATSVTICSKEVPDLMIVQVLARLPVKSLFQFKSVCKSWYALISDPYFIRLYSHISKSNPNPSLIIQLKWNNLLYVDSSANRSLFSINSFLKFAFLMIRASNNGLLCIVNLRDPGNYYVCNPLTRQSRSLPLIKEAVTTYAPSFVGLAFHPSSFKFHVLLAGFLEPHTMPHDQLICWLFDSETDSWNRIVLPLHETDSWNCFKSSFLHESFTSPVVFSGNSFHWLNHTRSYLLALDVDSLVSRKIALPPALLPDIGYVNNTFYLLEMEGLVSVIQITKHWMSMWVLRDSETGDNWILERRVHLLSISQWPKFNFPVSHSKDMVLLASPMEVVTYHWKYNACKRICAGDCNWLTNGPYRFYSLSFKGTLFSPCQLPTRKKLKRI